VVVGSVLVVQGQGVVTCISSSAGRQEGCQRGLPKTSNAPLAAYTDAAIAYCKHNVQPLTNAAQSFLLQSFLVSSRALLATKIEEEDICATHHSVVGQVLHL
jgi:hypothetical protein